MAVTGIIYCDGAIILLIRDIFIMNNDHDMVFNTKSTQSAVLWRKGLWIGNRVSHVHDLSFNQVNRQLIQQRGSVLTFERGRIRTYEELCSYSINGKMFFLALLINRLVELFNNNKRQLR